MPKKHTCLGLLLAWLVCNGLSGCRTGVAHYRMQTGAGDIHFKVFTRKAPVTAANFIRYVEEDRFGGAHFYRVVRPDNQPDNAVKIEVIQGGLEGAAREAGLPPIAHETTAQTGIRHKDGTLSMARLQPGSASSEFFICINAQPALDFGGNRNPDGQGFAAFGRVTRGMAVVRAIQAGAADRQVLRQRVKILAITKTR
ncbi:MAG: peptidylprolyl isomerase [Cytophagales bacterium]|nr:peptidylprolyl isomerase [Cytophagales bacterium]